MSNILTTNRPRAIAHQTEFGPQKRVKHRVWTSEKSKAQMFGPQKRVQHRCLDLRAKSTAQMFGPQKRVQHRCLDLRKE